MSAARRLRISTAPRLEATSEQIDALNAALEFAVYAAQREIANSQNQLDSCTANLDKATDEEGKAFYSEFVSRWLGHLLRDREKLAQIKTAYDFMIRAQITRIESRS